MLHIFVLKAVCVCVCVTPSVYNSVCWLCLVMALTTLLPTTLSRNVLISKVMRLFLYCHCSIYNLLCCTFLPRLKWNIQGCLSLEGMVKVYHEGMFSRSISFWNETIELLKVCQAVVMMISLIKSSMFVNVGERESVQWCWPGCGCLCEMVAACGWQWRGGVGSSIVIYGLPVRLWC